MTDLMRAVEIMREKWLDAVQNEMTTISQMVRGQHLSRDEYLRFNAKTSVLTEQLSIVKQLDLSAIVASVQSEQHPTPQPAQTDKALQLCREHAELVGAIKPMARQIGEALSECPKEKKYGGNNNHLTDWFKENRYDAPDEYFGDDEPCENCWKAYLLIQDRKKLRSQLRIVRMRITKLGKSATP